MEVKSQTRLGAQVRLVQAMLSIVNSPADGIATEMCAVMELPSAIVEDYRWSHRVPVCLGLVDTGAGKFATAITRIGSTFAITVCDLANPMIAEWLTHGYTRGLLIGYTSDRTSKLVRTSADVLRGALDQRPARVSTSDLNAEIRAIRLVLEQFDEREALARLGLEAEDIRTIYMSSLRVARSAEEAKMFMALH